MASVSIHQAIHGYRDGHRLLSSSTPLSADATRTMLVLSDMSGPSMLPGFHEYLTGYPLPASEFFVLAKTWYAPEMQRPGCVWTHSLLIPRTQVPYIAASDLLEKFRRPQIEGVEKAATTPIVFDDADSGSSADGSVDRAVTAALVSAILGQPRPVIVVVDTATELEMAVLQLWEGLWPAEKVRFSFCTGALMPRSNAGALLELQAIPRTIPPSQFRKSAGAVLVLDLRAPSKTEAWVDLVLNSTARSKGSFRTWLEAAAGADARRSVVPSLAPIFSEWRAPNSSARSIVASVVNANDLDVSVRSRLVGMAFERADMEAGASGRRELVQSLCGYRDIDLASIASTLEDQTRRLFEDSRADGITLVLSLLGSGLTEVGERVLRAAVLSLVPSDLETLGDAQMPFLSTIVGANPTLASSPALWSRVGSRSAEVLSRLAAMNLNDEERCGVVDAVISSGRDIPVDALVCFGGKIAIFRGLTALTSGEIQLSWQWRSVLSSRSDTVLEWLEGLSSPSLRELELSSRFLNPKATQSRLALVWKNGTAGVGSITPRVAVFGLTLAFWEGSVHSPLLADCFQPTFDAAGNSHLEYEEWDWIREQAPPVSWWREWDKCERLAGALTRLLERQSASLEIVFRIVRSRQAIRKVAAVLDDESDMRPYLKSLRMTAESSSIGTPEQRDALLKDR